MSPPRAKPLVDVQDIIDRRHELVEESHRRRSFVVHKVVEDLCSMIHGSLHAGGLYHVLCVYDRDTGTVVSMGDMPRKSMVRMLRGSADSLERGEGREGQFD